MAKPGYKPIQLYRQILKLHRYLNAEERQLGDAYIKAEFKAHKDLDKDSKFLPKFFEAWIGYKTMLEGQVRIIKVDKIKGYLDKEQTDAKLGIKFEKETFDKLSEEQVDSLYELFLETKKIK